MRIYNNSQQGSNPSGNSSPSCSYCRDESHRATDCPHIDGDWAHFQNFTIPCSDPDNWTNNPVQSSGNQRSWNQQDSQARWFKDPSGWSKWYTACRTAKDKKDKALAKRAKAQAKGQTRTARACGFCGSFDHTRRKCPKMESFIEKAIQANREWRRQFYDEFVGRLGLSEGALIQTSQTRWNTNATTTTGIITSVNWDELHFGCDRNYAQNKHRWRDALHDSLAQNIVITYVADGQTKRTSIEGDLANALRLGSLVSRRSSWTNVDSITVLSPSEKPQSAEWIDQGHEDAVRFACKKRSYEQLKEQGFVGLVEKWFEKSKTIYLTIPLNYGTIPYNHQPRSKNEIHR